MTQGTEKIYTPHDTKSGKRIFKIDEFPVTSIFLLDDLFPHHRRHIILKTLGYLLFFLMLLCFFAIIIYFSKDTSLLVQKLPAFFSSDGFGILLSKMIGVFLFVFSFWLLIYELELFHRSLYFHNRENRTPGAHNKTHVVSEIIELFYRSPEGDLLGAFFSSPVGVNVLLRLDIYEQMNEFQSHRANIQKTNYTQIKEAGIIRREDLVDYLYEKQEDFASFLFQNNISKNDLEGAVAWVVKMDLMQKYQERWWARSRLRKFPSIGKEWAYGGAYVLERYGSDIQSSLGGEHTSDFKNRRKHYVEEVEAILSKTTEANVLLLGDDGVGTLEVVRDLARRILTGAVPPTLVAHRLILLDTDLLLSATQSKGDFELEFMRILLDANKAGNVILVFNHFSTFLQSAEVVGSDALHLLEKYLTNSEMKIIALENTDSYQQTLETNSRIINRFTPIKISEPSDMALLGILQDYVPALEYEYKIFITYPALVEVAHSAKYYLTDGVLPDKAIDLLQEILPKASQSGDEKVSRQDVQKYVSERTNIPLGEIDTQEREKLENLEGELQKIVVGQERAVKVLADSIRESRAGIRSLDRPVGSFLFLGPTGVGKTQMTKAIARVYFGDSEAMSRLDMSEYQGYDALERLIGSLGSGKVGILSATIKKRPYGVLLLDEFEKANKEVHDLFLQILDEGFFSDMNGKKVNARNLIIIATSNAGSEMIWQARKEGQDVSQMKEALIEHIIAKGTYRPEFLNRFDEVVVFHPLTEENLREVARIMLEDTKKMIREQGYDLIVNDTLIDHITRVGYDPTFGARPMRRAIKDTVEKVIADKVIAGTLHTGESILLTPEDFQ